MAQYSCERAKEAKQHKDVGVIPPDENLAALIAALPDPKDVERERSKTHEIEMDVNEIVSHTREESTAEGVTPSFPNAIADLFQEVESIGSVYSTTGVDDDDDDDNDGDTDADASEGSTHERQHYVKGDQRQTEGNALRDEEASIGREGSASESERSAGTAPMSKASSASSNAHSGDVAGGKVWQRSIISSETQPNVVPLHDGNSCAAGPEGKTLGAADMARLEGEPPSSLVAPTLLGASGPSLGVSEKTTENMAALRRKTSMGSFQKGMGESLTGRLRKQLDISREPRREIDLGIRMSDVKDVKYLAQGAMCAAYTATLHGESVVLKTPLPDSSHADVAANDLEVEMLLLRELHHDNIVSIKGAGFWSDGRRFVALENLSGGTLSDVLRQHKSSPLELNKVIDLSLALCNALQYLHDVAVPGRIICHRDLKPDNIAFSRDGTLKLIDFGLGKIIKRKFRVRADKYHMTGGTGSLRYMAPEVADHQEYNEKGDVYSFSLILWEMLSGSKPFLGLKRPDFYNRVVDRGERPPLDPAWPAPLRELLEQCWRTNLDERLSFREVAGILKVCAEEEHQRQFMTCEKKRKSIRESVRRSRLWTTTGARPDLEEIARDSEYKPRFKISSIFSSQTSGTAGAGRRGSGSGAASKSPVGRTRSSQT